MENTIILMQSRTGSSLVANVFRAHGWVSNADSVRSRNYVTHENQRIKRYLVDTYGRELQRPVPPLDAPDQALRQIVRDEFGEKVWLWKGDVYFANVWLATFSPAIVYVQRDIQEAIESGLKGRLFPILQGGQQLSRSQAAQRLGTFLEEKYAFMDELKSHHGGTIVQTSEVMAGKLDTVQKAVKAAGGSWSAATAKRAITP